VTQNDTAVRDIRTWENPSPVPPVRFDEHRRCLLDPGIAQSARTVPLFKRSTVRGRKIGD
jgi:hypothetical protein